MTNRSLETIAEKGPNHVFTTEREEARIAIDEITRLCQGVTDAKVLIDATVEYFETTGCPKCCRGEREQNCIYHVARRLKFQWQGNE